MLAKLKQNIVEILLLAIIVLVGVDLIAVLAIAA